MNQLEERLRTAFQEKASRIPPEAPPLRLDPLRRAADGSKASVTRRWLAPVAAAAAVAAVAAAVTMAGAAGHPMQSADSVVRPVPVSFATIPSYYVALVRLPLSGNATEVDMTAQVRATGTGAVIATLPPPRPYVSYEGVSAAADDRTFVLEARGRLHRDGAAPTERFYLLRINPAASLASQRAKLTPLQAALIPPSVVVSDPVLSPNGTLLAFSTDVIWPAADSADAVVIDNLSTGTRRQWSAPTFTQPTSWTANGRYLALNVFGPPQVRLVSPDAPGDRLIPASRAVTVDGPPLRAPGHKPVPFDKSSWDTASITPDGRSIVIAARAYAGYVVRFTRATGEEVGTLTKLTASGGNWQQVLWMNETGTTLVISENSGSGAGILKNGHYSPIPWAEGTVTAAF